MEASEIGAELEVQFCSRCKEMVAPELVGEEECCPFCSETVGEFGDYIDAVHEMYRERACS